jgi:hypothetical protein
MLALRLSELVKTIQKGFDCMFSNEKKVDFETEEMNEEKKTDKLKDASEKALDAIIMDLDSPLPWIRIKAQEQIFTRMNPPRKMRFIRLKKKIMSDIEDIVRVKQEIYLKMASAKISGDEAEYLLRIIDNIKDTMFEHKYLDIILEFKKEIKNDEAFQTFKNKSLAHTVQ